MDAPCMLVVETDRAIRETIRELFEEAAYSVVEAGTTEEALARLATCEEGSVVIFSSLPPQYGEGEFFRRVAKDGALLERYCYVCLSTNPGMIAPDLFRLLVRARVPVLPKPFDVDLLEKAVADVRKSRARRVKARRRSAGT